LPDGTWNIKACHYGLGCGSASSIFVQGSDFGSANAIVELYLQEPPITQTRNQAGGPGDLNPGVWWNKYLHGSGWNFYWASSLRYPSTFSNPTIHEAYGNTYDLIGVWTTFKFQNGYWTPIWLYARMKATTDTAYGCDPNSAPNNVSCTFFEGDLKYFTNSSNNGFSETNAGFLRVFFDDSTNQRALLNLSINSTEGILTHIADVPSNNDCQPNDCISIAADGSYNIPLTDFNLFLSEPDQLGGLTEDQRWGPGNDADHFSGMWWGVSQNGVIPDFSYLMHLDRNFEWSTMTLYDGLGDPVWVTAQTCGSIEDGCGTPDAGYYHHDEVYIVKDDYNPLHYKTNGYFYEDRELIDVGSIKRQFYRDGSFNKGWIWGEINIPSNTLSGRPVGAFLSLGSNLSQSTHTIKATSFHDIRFFVNDYDESVITCDPNSEGYCDTYLTWFTDDDFANVQPYVSVDGGAYELISQTYCNIPPSGYVVERFHCNLPYGHSYRFQLHKPSHANNGTTVAIAESEELTISACTQSSCQQSTGVPLPPAPAPEIVDLRNDISADPNNDVVGSTTGSFDIDQFGNANYTIPVLSLIHI